MSSQAKGGGELVREERGLGNLGKRGRRRGRECKRASRIGWAHDGARVARACSTLKWSLATKKRDALAWGGEGGWLSDIISVVVRLDFLGGPAKGKVDWNPLNV